MHAYATDATDRMKVPVRLGALAVGIAFVLYLVLDAAGVVVPWWLDVPGPFGIGMALLGVYDRNLWRLKVGPLRLSSIPYLGGTWEGTLETSFGDNPGPHVGTLRIRQTWSSIEIQYEPASRRSTSCSTMAAVNASGSSQPSLVYEYANDPRSLAEASMAPHRGVARLHLVARQQHGATER